MQMGIITVLLAVIVGQLFIGSYLWDKLVAAEDELEQVRGYSDGNA